ncbi:hypothetical protein Q7689_24450, partial [Nocardiopsis tropica]|nr:hypothetical protein [Nocardiopsis tropica]
MKDLDTLFRSVLAEPDLPPATSVFWVHHGTRLAGGGVTYLNQYVLVRVGRAFGACAFEQGALDPAVCAEASGAPLRDLLLHGPLPLRLAALDAYLGQAAPHAEDPLHVRGDGVAPLRAPQVQVAGKTAPSPLVDGGDEGVHHADEADLAAVGLGDETGDGRVACQGPLLRGAPGQDDLLGAGVLGVRRGLSQVGVQGGEPQRE